MTSRRRQAVLAALGGAGLLAVVFAARDDRPTGAARVRAAGATPADASASASPPVTDLKLELLAPRRAGVRGGDPAQGPGAEFVEPERNPFRFQPRPAPRPAPGPRAIVTPPPPAAAPTGPPPPPPIPLRFIGLVDAPGQAGRVAILSDGRGNVFHGKEGDIIEGRYRVGRVGPDSLELSYTDARGRQVIRLSGQ
ncbi:MAG: hypothetical protein HYY76_08515 [Acidobacteria bacterium]|nr:hypothetical protein [Acidobacteriota bacterium]